MEWLKSVEPEGWAAIAAAIIAALSLVSQAVSQRQQVRLGLFEKRLELSNSILECANRLRRSGVYDQRLFLSKESYRENVKRELIEVRDDIISLQLSSVALFGDEVYRLCLTWKNL